MADPSSSASVAAPAGSPAAASAPSPAEPATPSAQTPGPVASSAPPAPTATEIIHRPDAGTLARGRWEAPTWAFYVSGAAVVLLALVYAGARVGLFTRRRAGKT